MTLYCFGDNAVLTADLTGEAYDGQKVQAIFESLVDTLDTRRLPIYIFNLVFLDRCTSKTPTLVYQVRKKGRT